MPIDDANLLHAVLILGVVLLGIELLLLAVWWIRNRP
jgi:hypothetical protein